MGRDFPILRLRTSHIICQVSETTPTLRVQEENTGVSSSPVYRRKLAVNEVNILPRQLQTEGEEYTNLPSRLLCIPDSSQHT